MGKSESDADLIIPSKEIEQKRRAVAKTAEEACEFVKAGSEYITGEYDDDGKTFRKRK